MRMSNKIQSLAVGTSLENNQFAAIVLKLRLENGSLVRTRWDRNMAEKLLRALGEYMLYLHTKKIDMNSDAVNEIIINNVPPLDQNEIDNPDQLISDIKGRVEPDQSLKLFVQLQQENELKEIVISPEYVMPLNDQVGSILDSFDSFGKLRPPSDTMH
jgi:hypothetical protein